MWAAQALGAKKLAPFAGGWLAADFSGFCRSVLGGWSHGGRPG
jgi:hypothetical protein